MINRFNALNLGQKINLGFAALVLVLLLVVGFIFGAGRVATDKINLTVDVRVPTTLAATSAQSNLLKMQAAVRGYLAVGDLRNIDEYNQAKERFQQKLAELNSLSTHWSDPEDIDRLEQLIETFAAWLPLPEELFTLHDNPLQNQPALQLETVDMQPLNTKLLANVDLLSAHLESINDGVQTEYLLRETSNFRTTFDGMSTNLSAYAATGDLIFKFRYSTDLVANSQHFGQLADAGETLESDPNLVDAFTQITSTRNEILTLSNRIFSAVEGEQSQRDLYLFQNQMQPQTDKMIMLLEGLAVGQQALLQTELDDGKRSLNTLLYQTGLGGALVLLLGAAMVYIFRRNIAKPIHRLSNTADRIGAGELSARATVETTDEIGQLALTFNRMTDQLNETFDQLAQSKETAESANRAKSRFLASMSHELRTPLNAILGYVQILRRNDQLDPTQTKGLNVIQTNGEHLLGFINDILDLSKIEASKLELLPTRVSLPSFLAEIVQPYESHALVDNRVGENGAAKTGVHFRTELSSELPRIIEADDTRLRQILINLLENAFKFTEEGSVTLTASVQDRSAADMDAANDPHEVARLIFTVHDTGIGMSPRVLDQIFRPFEQLGDSRQRAKGTGLGLAIARELVYAMDGELTVESTPNVGSRFAFSASFPASWAEAEQDSLSPAYTNGQPHPQDHQPAASPKSTSLFPKNGVAAPVALSPVTAPSVAPPAADLSDWLDMALKGELPKLQKQAQHLAAARPIYAPFVEKLCGLIDAYDEARIVELLRSHIASSV